MIPIPGISLPGLQSLPPMDFGGGPSGASSSGINLNPSLLNPFNFDNSNWQVSVKSSGSQAATSASGSTPGAGLPVVPLLLLGAAWFFLK